MQRGTREKPLKDVPRCIAPMRPKMVPSLPEDRAQWLLEPKLDGYRVIAVKSSGHANLYSMDSKVYNQEFPGIYQALEKLLLKTNDALEANATVNDILWELTLKGASIH